MIQHNDNQGTDEPEPDYKVQSYQDDIDTDQNKTDPIMSEQNDDPVETFGVPANELRDELDKRDLDNPDTTDDMREEIEGLDENSSEGGRQ